MAWALLTSTPSSLFAGPGTCGGICLPAVFMPWQIPQDARTWRLVKAEKRITSWQIMFFVSPHILVVPSSFTNTETSLYRLHHPSNLTVTSTNSIREDAEVTLVHIWSWWRRAAKLAGKIHAVCCDETDSEMPFEHQVSWKQMFRKLSA